MKKIFNQQPKINSNLIVQSSSEEDGSSGGSSSRNHESYSKYRDVCLQ